MGFFNSLAHEAGKKTGKAIGNALFGSYADDQRISIRGGVDNSDTSTQLELHKQTLELEAELKEKERNQKMLDELLLLEFDGECISNNIKILTRLSSMIDVWMKDEDMQSFYEVARSKFDTGLMISQAIDANNSMVIIMSKKQDEWNMYLAKQKEEQELAEQKRQEQIANLKLKAKQSGKKVAIIAAIIIALWIILMICLEL